MSPELTIAIIGVSAALLGTISGGFISYFSSKSIKNMELSHLLLKEEIEEKKTAHTKFLTEAHFLIEHLISGTDISLKIVELMTTFHQIELVFEDTVIKKARNIIDLFPKHYPIKVNHLENELIKDFIPLRDEYLLAVKNEIKSTKT